MTSYRTPNFKIVNTLICEYRTIGTEVQYAVAELGGNVIARQQTEAGLFLGSLNSWLWTWQRTLPVLPQSAEFVDQAFLLTSEPWGNFSSGSAAYETV